MIRAFSWVLSGDVASRIAVLVTTLFAVRALSPSEFGLYVVLYAIALVAAAVWDLGASVVVSREVGAGRLTERTALARASRMRVLGLPTWIGALAIGLVLARSFPTLSPRVCLPFLIASASAGLSVLSLSAMRGAHRFLLSSVAQALGKWSTAGLSAAAFVFVGGSDRLLALGVAFAVGEVVTLVVSVGMILASRSALALDDAGLISFRQALPFAANAAMSMIYNRSDVVLVGALASASVAGLYGAASRGQDALYAIPAALGAVALPMISRVADEGGPEAVRKLIVRFWRFGLAVALPVALVVFLAAPTIVPWLLGDAYSGAVRPLRVLVWFLPLAVIQAPILAGLAGIREGGQTTLIILVTLLASVVLQVLLTPEFGAIGAAAASLGRDVVATPLALLIGYRFGLIGAYRPASEIGVTS